MPMSIEISEELPKSQTGSMNIEDDDLIYDVDDEAIDPDFSPDSGDLCSESPSVEPETESDPSLHQQSFVRSCYSESLLISDYFRTIRIKLNHQRSLFGFYFYWIFSPCAGNPSVVNMWIEPISRPHSRVQ